MFNNQILDMFETVLSPDSVYLTQSKIDILKKLKNLDFIFKPVFMAIGDIFEEDQACLLYTSPSPRDLSTSRMPSSA